jgi:hypothetical protein
MKRWIPAAAGVVSLGGIVAYIVLAKPFANGAPPAPSVGPAMTATPAEPSPPREAPPSAKTELPTPSAPGFDRLPDGQPIPALPKEAPSRLKFGVVLFEYDGSQPPPGQATRKTRSKAAALELAKKTIELAKSDFAAAVAKGDRGSIANAGSISRGILEPSVEYQLFTLAKGEVRAEPIDTPRGFWVARRIE